MEVDLTVYELTAQVRMVADRTVATGVVAGAEAGPGAEARMAAGFDIPNIRT